MMMTQHGVQLANETQQALPLQFLVEHKWHNACQAARCRAGVYSQLAT